MKFIRLILLFLVAGTGSVLAQNYCGSSGPVCGTTANTWITRVQLATINNNSTCAPGGYADYTDQLTLLEPNQSYTATVNCAGYDGPDNLCAVYIDLNADGAFTDVDERFLLNYAGTANRYSGTISMPATLPNATVRIRVVVSWTEVAPCGSYSYGQTEDYSTDLNQVQCGVLTDAGADVAICDGSSTVIGGSPSGSMGTAPLVYAWTPTTGLNDASLPNPTASPSATTTYTLTITDDNGNGCSVSDDVVVTVNPLPAKPAITFTPADPICEPSTVTLTSDDADTYQWYLDGVEIAGEVAKTHDAGQTGDYTVKAIDANGCGTLSDPVSLTVYPEVIPSLSSSNPTVCAPDSVLLYVDNWNSDLEVKWFKGGVLITGETNDSLYVQVSDDYHVETSYTGNVCTQTSNVVTASIVGNLPKPVVSAVGPGSFCSNDNSANPTVTLTNDLAGLEYQWYENGILIPGAESQNYTTSNTGSFHVIVSSASCDATSDPFIVGTSTPSKPSITSTQSFPKCPETIAVLQSSTATAYQWVLNGLEISGAEDQTYDATQPGLYKVIGFNAEGCSDTSFSFDVTNHPGSAKLIIAPDGPTVFCEGDSVRLFAQGASNYVWYLDGNAISGANAGSYLALTSGSYHVTYSDANGCDGTADPVSVTVNPAPTKPTITSPNGPSVCTGDTVLLIASAGNSGYQWFLDGDSLLGATNDSLKVVVGGGYKVRITDTEGCTNESNNYFVTVKLEKKPKISLIGGVAGCDGDVRKLTSNYDNGNQWYLNGVIINGANQKSYDATVSGDYHFIVTAQGGGCSASSDTITLTFSAGPGKPSIAPNADTVICIGETIELSTTSTNFKRWFRDGIEIPGEQGKKLNVTMGGGYFVEVADQNNCTAFSDTVLVYGPFDERLVLNHPNDTTVCANDNYRLETNHPTYAHTWYKNGAVIIGATTSEYVVTSPGNYRAEAKEGRCTDATNTVVVSHLPAPATNPTITVTGPTIFCKNTDQAILSANNTGGLHYEWVKDGVNIPNSANADYTATQAGDYTLVVYNALGCTDSSASTSILNFPQPKITNVLVVKSTCPGADDAQVTIQAGGGGGSILYSFDGSQYGYTSRFDNVAPGFYWANIVDNNGCQDSAEVFVGEAQSDLYVYAVLDNNITCNNDNNAQITATGTGGNGLLEYSINGGQTWTTDEVFTGLTGGIYTITVRDTNGCTYESSPPIPVSNPSFMSMFVTIDNNITCQDDNDGSITAETNGGTGFKQFKLNNGPWINAANTYTWTNLAEGTYIVKSRDERGCIRTSVEQYITNPDPLVVERVFLAKAISCFGAADATIEVQVSGGGGGYQYSLDGNNYQFSNRFSNLGPGAHTVRVTDVRGCLVTAAPIFISQPTKINVSATVVQHADCFGSATGRVAVAGSGGVGDLAFSLDGNVYMIADTIDGVRAGTYTVYAMDEKGCIGETINTITVTQGNSIQMITTITDVSCYDAFDGSIVVTANGGAGGLEYAIGTTFYQGSNSFTGLSGGTYTISVRDQGGCVATRTVIVDEPTELIFEATPVHVRCFGQNDGQLIALASGGTQPYQYSFNGGATYISNPVKTAVGPGVYTVMVRDAKGCIKSAQAIVQQPSAPLTLAFSKEDVSCNSAQDGVINISAAGGTGNLSFSLDNGSYQTDSVYTNLNPGFYIIHVRDENFCVESMVVVIDQPNVLSANLTLTDGVSCDGDNDAVLTASVTGGTAPYRYTLDLNLPYTLDDEFTNLSPGDYTVYVKDANGCTDSSEVVTVNAPSPINVTAVLNKGISCNGASDARIIASGSGGTGFLQYSINGGPAQASPTFAGLGSGNFVVTVFDANGCSKTSNLITISEPQQMFFSGGVDKNVTCFNGSDGRIILNITGGTAPIQYSINGNDFFTSPTFNNVSAGTYSPKAVDANGCEIILSNNLVVTQPSEIIITGSITDESNGNDGAIDLTVTGGAFPYTYLWNLGQTVADLTNIEGGKSYTVTVTDNVGCTKQATFFVPTHVGLEELLLSGGLSLYPNPNNGSFSLKIEANSGLVDFNWTLLNMIGEEISRGYKVVHATGNTYEFDFGQLPKGVYHMLLSDENSRTDLKLIIQ